MRTEQNKPAEKQINCKLHIPHIVTNQMTHSLYSINSTELCSVLEFFLIMSVFYKHRTYLLKATKVREAPVVIMNQTILIV